jgi:hypothetical protein
VADDAVAEIEVFVEVDTADEVDIFVEKVEESVGTIPVVSILRWKF